MSIFDSAIALDRKRSASKQDAMDGIMAMFAGMLASAAERQGAEKNHHADMMAEMHAKLEKALASAQANAQAITAEAAERTALAQQVAAIKIAPAPLAPPQERKTLTLPKKPQPASYSMDVQRGSDGLIKNLAVSGGGATYDMQVVREGGLLKKVNVIPRGA
jgi:hypothetical protein